MSWLYNGKTFESSDIGDFVGFVYRITSLVDGRMYIGKKLFLSSKTRQVKKKKKRIKVESDWKEYFGSNEELKEEVKKYGEALFVREILQLCKSKGECNYHEAREQFVLDVLRDPRYINQWISVKVHRKHLKQ